MNPIGIYMFINSRGGALHGYPPIVQGNKPWDGGYLILSAEERNEFLTKHPESEKYIKPFIGSYEFINGIPVQSTASGIDEHIWCIEKIAIDMRNYFAALRFKKQVCWYLTR